MIVERPHLAIKSDWLKSSLLRKVAKKLDFFEPTHAPLLIDKILESKARGRALTFIAIACPQLIHVEGGRPYGGNDTHTYLKTHTRESKVIKYRALLVNELTAFLARENVQVEVMPLVSNVEPMLYRWVKEVNLGEEVADLGISLTSPFGRFLCLWLYSQNMQNNYSDINRDIQASWENWTAQLDAPVNSHHLDHLQTLTQSFDVPLSDTEDRTDQVKKLLKEMLHVWPDLNQTSEFLEQLYEFDLTLMTAELVPSLCCVWLNMQAEDKGQSQLIERVVGRNTDVISYPVVRSIHGVVSYDDAL